MNEVGIIDTFKGGCYNSAMKKTNIALIGFMGVGKTLVSKELERDIGLGIFSTDETIVKQENMNIADIFEIKGENYFRQLEKRVVGEACQKTNVIIDCGGGVVLDSENVKTLKSHCTIIYLSANADTIYENIKDKNDRPLLNVDDPKKAIQDLLEKRSLFYEKAADYIVDGNNKTISQMAREVMDIVQ